MSMIYNTKGIKMANLRELIITTDGEYTIVESSPTGRENLELSGNFGTATVTLKQSYTFSDGTEEPSAIIADINATLTDVANFEIAVGTKRNLIINVASTTGSTRIVAICKPLN
ncbi:MAG: hypothetical protein COA84_14285 [Robiginitomaculum sp.]|nr:MAG: hypothetical protein COA84_14285 [Robiginitomaculum sp.]